MRYARKEGIRYAGRGSAADSLVAYCLYITEVDSLERNLLFERFINPGRIEMPDIDIDFEARHRDRVIDYVYKKYGHDYVARVATTNTFRARSAIRDIGKALGVKSRVDAIAKRSHYSYAIISENHAKAARNDKQSLVRETIELLLDVCEKIAGFPRFLVLIWRSGDNDCPLVQLTHLQRSGLGPVIPNLTRMTWRM